MSNLADLIEQYLRTALAQQNIVELQRRELAKMFRCAPSQINYVLETRFTLDQGFIIESKRGGGGYIRITHSQIPLNLPEVLDELMPEMLRQEEVEVLLNRLVSKEVIRSEIAQLVLVLTERELADLPDDYANEFRAKFVKTILMALVSINE
ncbi:MAG: CtsR family transcriptional regulator [Firmicutes bacterium]|nr:CtsR family transcriptional regulator [Bacillota bacterium]